MPDTSDLQIRLMEPLRDAPSVIYLYEMIFGHTVTPHMWAWKYLPSWTERHHAYVLETDDKIVGYYGAVPVRGMVDGKPTPFFQIGDIMVHPEYRAKHRYFNLGSEALIADLEGDYPERVIYGFSNHRAFLYLKRLGFCDLLERVMHREVEVAPVSPKASYSFEDLEWNDPRIDEAWERFIPSFGSGLIRDSRYLKWRYRDHPANQYKVVGVSIGGDSVGWLVLGGVGGSKPEQTRKRAIVDLIIPKDRIRSVLESLASELSAPLCIWLPDHLAENLPRTKDSGAHLYHVPKGSLRSTESLKNDLYYTMGDVDWW